MPTAWSLPDCCLPQVALAIASAERERCKSASSFLLRCPFWEHSQQAQGNSSPLVEQWVSAQRWSFQQRWQFSPMSLLIQLSVRKQSVHGQLFPAWRLLSDLSPAVYFLSTFGGVRSFLSTFPLLRLHYSPVGFLCLHQKILTPARSIGSERSHRFSQLAFLSSQ